MEKKYKILIVEDTRIDRFRLHSFLDDEYLVMEAENGTEALGLLHENADIDLVISDLMMPGMSGKELLAELAESKKLNELPVLIATSTDDIKDELECLELGCTDFIHKPYNPKLLKMRVENTLVRMEYNRIKQQKIKDTFDRFVDPVIVDSLLDPNNRAVTQLRNITVLFADIRRFTTISEHLPPEEVLALLNGCFEITSRCVKKYGGVLDKYIGDCTMAFWRGTADGSEDGAYPACCAAVEMMEMTKEALARLSDNYGMEVALGIGINSGPAIVGNVGSLDRMNYTVIGDTVNVASRLESIAPVNSIYIGESVYRSACDHIVAEKFPASVILKGRERPACVYELKKVSMPSTPGGVS